VIDMSMLGAAGVSRWLGDIQSAHSFVPLLRLSERGDVDIECVPPAITTRSMPARIEAAAVVTAVRPAAQCRLTAAPGTCSMPASIAT
jgi:hypothetical protein